MCGAVYANNLSYFICFFLVALFIIGMHQANNNLKGLKVDKLVVPLSPAHSSQTAWLWLRSSSNNNHIQVQVSCKDPHLKLSGTVPLVRSQSLGSFTISAHVEDRGSYQLKQLTLSSVSPLGLFYVWKKIPVETYYEVYPQPLHHTHPFPFSQEAEKDKTHAHYFQGEEFYQHRFYQQGDSHRHVDWKAFARGRPLLIKDFQSPQSSMIQLDLESLSGSLEEKLRKMSYWVLQCEKQRTPFVMRLDKSAAIASNRSDALRALAKYQGAS